MFLTPITLFLFVLLAAAFAVAGITSNSFTVTLSWPRLESAPQSAHVYRCRTDHNNWLAIVELYAALLALTASPVVALNRALAIAEIHSASAASASWTK